MHHGGQEDVDHRAGLGSGEALRADADDLVKVIADAERAPDHLRISSEAVRPIVVREHRVGVRAGLQIVAFGEQPSRRGPKSKGAEHPPGNVLAVGFFHLRVRSVGQIGPVGIRDRHQLGLVLRRSAHQSEIRIGPTVEHCGFSVGADCLASQSVQLLGLRHRQWPQQQGVDQPEGRGACPDPQSERKDRRGGGRLSLLELPPTEDGVGAQRIEPGDEADVAALLAQS